MTMSGCGSSSGATQAYDSGNYAPSEAAMAEEVGEDYAAYDSMDDMSADASWGGLSSGIDLTSHAQAEQKLIYTCDISLETLTYEESLSAINALIEKCGAIIQNEDTSDNNYNWYSPDGGRRNMWTALTIRVPSESYSEFINGLENASGHVTSKRQNVENITRAYSDQSILVEALEKQEKRLLEMMDEASTVEDMIAVEDRLSDVQTELNQAKTVLAGMDTDIYYSTINLTVEEVTVYSERSISFGERLGQSFGNSWSNFVSWLGDVLIDLIYFFPFLLVFVLFVTAVILIVRAVLKKSHKRHEAKKTARSGKAAGYDNAAKAEEAVKDKKETEDR